MCEVSEGSVWNGCINEGSIICACDDSLTTPVLNKKYGLARKGWLDF